MYLRRETRHLGATLGVRLLYALSRPHPARSQRTFIPSDVDHAVAEAQLLRPYEADPISFRAYLRLKAFLISAPLHAAARGQRLARAPGQPAQERPQNAGLPAVRRRSQHPGAAPAIIPGSRARYLDQAPA